MNKIKQILRVVKRVLVSIEAVLVRVFFLFCRLFPLQNKVVASTFKGMKYGDNPQYIIEKLSEINPKIKLVWVKNDDYIYSVPEKFKVISTYSTPWKRAYHYATAKVWLDTHKFPLDLKKRKNQIVINTWHGGLGIKKIDMEVDKFRNDERLCKEISHTCDLTDVFVSNSEFLNTRYREAFGYKGEIFKPGFPRNDILVNGNKEISDSVRKELNISDDRKILLYAPTFRDSCWSGNLDMSVYDIEFDRLCVALEQKTGCKWTILIKFHPFLIKQKAIADYKNESIINVTEFQNMQGLLLVCDAFISDYSSCMFDVALCNIPVFTFATDFDTYKNDRGVYYEMHELPFPFARNNDELIENICNYDFNRYLVEWDKFKKETGLSETGNASFKVANLINKFINKGTIVF